jgi:hypothetical protein
VEVTALVRLFVESDVCPVAEHFIDQTIVFGLRAVTPDGFCRFHQARTFINPLLDWGSHRTSKKFQRGECYAAGGPPNAKSAKT